MRKVGSFDVPNCDFFFFLSWPETCLSDVRFSVGGGGGGGGVEAPVASTQGNINTSGEIRTQSKLVLSHKHKLVLFLRHWGHDQAIGDKISIMLSSFSLIRQTERTFHWMETNSESFFRFPAGLFTILRTGPQNRWAIIDIDHDRLSVPLTLNARGPTREKKKKDWGEIENKRTSANPLRRPKVCQQTPADGCTPEQTRSKRPPSSKGWDANHETSAAA